MEKQPPLKQKDLFDNRLRIPVLATLPLYAGLFAFAAIVVGWLDFRYNGVMRDFHLGFSECWYDFTYAVRALFHGYADFGTVCREFWKLLRLASMESLCSALFLILLPFTRREARIQCIPLIVYCICQYVHLTLLTTQTRSLAVPVLVLCILTAFLLTLMVLGAFSAKHSVLSAFLVLMLMIIGPSLFNEGIFYEYQKNAADLYILSTVHLGRALSALLLCFAYVLWVLALSNNWNVGFYAKGQIIVLDIDGREILLDEKSFFEREMLPLGEEILMEEYVDFEPVDNALVQKSDRVLDPSETENVPESLIEIEEDPYDEILRKRAASEEFLSDPRDDLPL